MSALRSWLRRQRWAENREDYDDAVIEYLGEQHFIEPQGADGEPLAPAPGHPLAGTFSNLLPEGGPVLNELDMLRTEREYRQDPRLGAQAFADLLASARRRFFPG